MPRRRRLVLPALIAFVAVGAAATVALLALWPVESTKRTIAVRSAPEGATVVINGRRLEKTTPLVVPANDLTGPITIQVSKPSYETWTDTTTFEPGEKQKVVIASLVAKKGKIEVHSRPEGADIYIDNEYRGSTPTILENLTLTQPVSFQLRKRGYRRVSRKIAWKGQRWMKITITLRRQR